MSRSHLLVLAPVLLALSVALPAKAEIFKQPDLISVDADYFDFDKSEPNKQSADFRLEYRWGMSLLPMISENFRGLDTYMQLHPFIGGQVTTLGMLYGLGGFALDVNIGRHGIFTWSEGVGLYEAGNMTTLGSVIEFRSQAELGWRFDNNMRITGQVSHISNAGLTQRNPGAEMAGLYLHVPVDMVMSRMSMSSSPSSTAAAAPAKAAYGSSTYSSSAYGSSTY